MPGTLYARPWYCHFGDKKPRSRETEPGAQLPTRWAEQKLTPPALRLHSLNALRGLGLRDGGTTGRLRGASLSTSTVCSAPDAKMCPRAQRHCQDRTSSEILNTVQGSCCPQPEERTGHLASASCPPPGVLANGAFCRLPSAPFGFASFPTASCAAAFFASTRTKAKGKVPDQHLDFPD